MLFHRLPFELCDASVIQTEKEIFVIGGCTLKPDCRDENFHYFEPQNSFWIFDLSTLQWNQGPALPISTFEEDTSTKIGFARGSAYLVKNKILIYSGGVQLVKHSANQSNQVDNVELLFIRAVFDILFPCRSISMSPIPKLFIWILRKKNLDGNPSSICPT